MEEAIGPEEQHAGRPTGSRVRQQEVAADAHVRPVVGEGTRRQPRRAVAAQRLTEGPRREYPTGPAGCRDRQRVAGGRDGHVRSCLYGHVPVQSVQALHGHQRFVVPVHVQEQVRLAHREHRHSTTRSEGRHHRVRYHLPRHVVERRHQRVRLRIPSGQIPMNPGRSGLTTVTFKDAACAVADTPQCPATGKSRVDEATRDGGPNAPLNPLPRVSARRHGAIATKRSGAEGRALSSLLAEASAALPSADWWPWASMTRGLARAARANRRAAVRNFMSSVPFAPPRPPWNEVGVRVRQIPVCRGSDPECGQNGTNGGFACFERTPGRPANARGPIEAPAEGPETR